MPDMQNFKAGFYEKIFRALDTNAVLMRVEPDGSYCPIWCSQEFTEMMEGSVDQFIRMESGGTMSTIHPEDRDEVSYLFRHHKTKAGTNSLNVRKRTMKGNWIWVNIHYAFIEEDGVQYAYCMYFDVTSIKEREERAQSMYEQTRSKLEQMSSESLINKVLLNKALVEQYDMITYLMDGQYGVIIGEAERIQKGSIFPKQRTGTYRTYVEEQVAPVLRGSEQEKKEILRTLDLDHIESQLEKKEPYEVNITCEIEGELFYKNFVFYVVDRKARFYLLLKADTTEIQKAQIRRNEQLKFALEEANQANVAKTAFLSSMSHEIRTPMNAIIGLDSIALKEPNLPERTREHLEKIGASARHLLSLINDILDISRIESGRMILKNEEFSFVSMLEQINTICNSQCQDKGLEYDCFLHGKVDEYYIGDDMKLKQVLINILGNAIKFTHAPGSVSLSVERTAQFEDKSTLRFIVKDTGIGMEKDFLPKLFDAFSQEDGTNTTSYGGTGLGMAITKNIVEILNGTISVQSEKGVGSEFTVNVTLKNSKRTGQPLQHDLRLQDMKVLVVDDDPIACEHADLVLQEVGVVADICQKVDEALGMVKLNHARHASYNLILLDLKMPEQDGVELTRNIRKIIGDETAIIILTVYSWDHIMDEGIRAGVDSFMSKPLFASSLMEELRQAMQRKNMRFSKIKQPAELTGRHILLAEDMVVNAEIMKEVLRMREMVVDHAENGQQAVEMFRAHPEHFYDAVLMDVRMPVMDGLTAAKAIRALRRGDAKEVPIIALTANAFDEDVQRSLQAGMNAHLSKPVEPDQLYATLEDLIRV